MNKLLVKGALIGGIVVFLWGMFSWAVLPFHKMFVNHFINPRGVSQVIQENAPKTGVYVIPGMGMNTRRDQMQSRDGRDMQRGMYQAPFVTAYVTREGMDFRSPAPYIGSLVTQIIAAFFATLLLTHAKGLNFKKSVIFFTVLGLFAGLVGCLPKWTWMGEPFMNVFLCLLDLVIGWFLAGLAVAKWAFKK